MAIFTSQPNLGLSDGNLICGDMSGQHSKSETQSIYTIFPSFLETFLVYLPVNATSGEDYIRIFTMVGVGFVSSGAGVVSGQVMDYKWRIKIRQIDCKESDSLQGNFNATVDFEHA